MKLSSDSTAGFILPSDRCFPDDESTLSSHGGFALQSSSIKTRFRVPDDVEDGFVLR